MNYRYFSHNGKILPLAEALIPLENINLQYGFGVYESLKVRNNVLFFAEQHCARLMESARAIGLEHNFTPDQVAKNIKDLIAHNEIVSANMKMLLLGGRIREDSTLYILPLAPLYPNRKLYSHGATVETVQYERFLPNAKTLNMLPSYLFYTKAKQKGHYDALFTDRGDNILEGTRTNFFAIKDSALITPPKEKVLEGVTKITVRATAEKNGFTVREEDIPLKNLDQFDGAFLTSTSSKIIPLIQINEHVFPEIAPELKVLMKHYNDFLDSSNGIFTG